MGLSTLGLALLALTAACASNDDHDPPREEGRSGEPEVAASPLNGANEGLPADVEVDDAGAWRVLFDGRDRANWRAGVFGEDPEFEVNERGIVLPQGVPLAGLTYLGEPPSGAYTLEVRATKEYGGDFFLGVTFPVRDQHITLVLGGWGGVVCGLSCLDGEDASTNDTRALRSFPNGKSVTLSIDVTDERIVAQVDGESIVDVALAGREISLRPEVEPNVPLGIASFATCTTLHHVRVREARPPVPSIDDPSDPR